MIQVEINHDEMHHPIPCTTCGERADLLLMQRTVKGGVMKVEKTDARCNQHRPEVL
jgi:hypothetical protein